MKSKQPLVVNFFAGAGAGKSLVSHGVMYKLKLQHINCEYLPEYAKTLTWRKDFQTLAAQSYVSAKQHRYLFDLCQEDNNLEVIVTDTSLVLGLVYQGKVVDEFYEQWVVNTYKKFRNIGYFLKRDLSHSYIAKGRNQTEKEARLKDQEILDILSKYEIEYTEIQMNGEATVDVIVEDIMSALREEKS